MMKILGLILILKILILILPNLEYWYGSLIRNRRKIKANSITPIMNHGNIFFTLGPIVEEEEIRFLIIRKKRIGTKSIKKHPIAEAVLSVCGSISKPMRTEININPYIPSNT